ncbi:VWA domain-containing protein [Pseudorhodobacter sp.]|uniref:vWA domain-containing protein n=1 Tax=Pseudorhodobacter sp. TaxID=1934400 RepID=UPI0026488BBD|nr:VWA domain-containing protein [Pseudorhodobacter sp.]MDN5786871.1 VWA domain-containing protein [Pseudorhodobacter sp.]
MRSLGMISALALCATISQAQAEGKSIIVLDGSGSMWGQIDGRPKLEIAREALAGVLAGLPADTALGLMAYGHREKGNCGDIELIVPPGPGTGPAITDAANKMQFLGKTPLTEAVRRAAAELRSTEEKATVILITDGIETCEADPCALGKELEASGVDFTAHVVGFGLTADEGKQVACLAENTGGKYIEAKDAGSLIDALKTTVAAAPEPAPEPTAAPEPPKPAVMDYNIAPRIFLVEGGADMSSEHSMSVEVYTIKQSAIETDRRGDLVQQHYGNDPFFVDPGTYLLVVDWQEAEVEQEITLTADKLTTPDVIMNAGVLTIRPLTEAGGEPEGSASVDLTLGDKNFSYYGENTRVMPAGDYGLNVRIGNASVTDKLTLEAGEVKTQDVIVALGLAVLDTWYTPDMIMEETGQAVDIFKAKKSLDGKREDVTGSYGAAQEFKLPPGDYVATGRKEQATGEVEFTVKANARTDVKIVLNAGVLAMAAPGARTIEIFAAKKDIQGKRKSITSFYGEEAQSTITAGDYIVEAERDGVLSEIPATVTAGERTEVTVP